MSYYDMNTTLTTATTAMPMLTTSQVAALPIVNANGAIVGNGGTPYVYNVSSINSGLVNTGFVGNNYSYDVISFRGKDNKEVVSVKSDGTVVWADGIQINEAAEAFSRSMTLGSEMCAKITSRVRREIKDVIFDELHKLALEKGSITAEDIKYFHQCTKLMDKLKD